MIDDMDAREQKQKDDALEAQRLALRRSNDVREVGRSPHGRRLLWWILSESGLFRSPFAGEEVHTMAHLVGMGDLGRTVLNEINTADPTLFAKMQREYLSEALSKTKPKQEDE